MLRGKSELFDHLRKNSGQVFINGLDEYLMNMAKRFEKPVIYPEHDVKFLDSAPLLKYQVSDQVYTTNLVGDYNFPNVAVAIAIGRYLGVEEEKIHKALTSYAPTNNRSQVVKIGSKQVIQDSYNANPDSMKAALISLSKIPGSKLAILGDMYELEEPEKEHEKTRNTCGLTRT